MCPLQAHIEPENTMFSFNSSRTHRIALAAALLVGSLGHIAAAAETEASDTQSGEAVLLDVTLAEPQSVVLEDVEIAPPATVKAPVEQPVFVERALLPATFRVTNVAARIAEVAGERHAQGAAFTHRHYCQNLLRTTVQQVTPAYNRYFGDSALETMRAFQAAGIGMPYTSGMQLLPGDLLYTARMGGNYGHAMLVGPDGRIRDNVGSGIAAPWERKIDWVVRPSGGPVRLASGR